MKVKSFNYVKGNGQKSNRKVMVVEDNVDHIVGIDFTHLSAAKQNTLVTTAKLSTVNAGDYKEAIRRFQKNNMSGIKEELL